MNFTGIIIGAVSFLIIGIFHPIVIKTEYYFTKKVWPLFGLAGIALLLVSLTIQSDLYSPICAVVGITFLWSIQELFEQEKRVEKGWFPANPNRKPGCR